tara:strand:- start:235 stop:351 length:117 start_codon:yes stop_codon:yes gene_type:complete
MATTFIILNLNIKGVNVEQTGGSGGMSPLENLRILGVE